MSEHEHAHHPPAEPSALPPDASHTGHRATVESADVAHADPAHTHGGELHGGHDPRAGHDAHSGHSVAMFRDKFWWSLALTLPALVWGHMLQSALGYAAPHFPGATLIPAVSGTAVFLYGGTPFLLGAVREIRDRVPGMMVLISLAISVAFGFSVAVTLGFPGMPLWEELATLVTIMLLGHWIEMRSINQAQGALGELAKLLPDIATRVRTENAREILDDVAVSALRDGDVLLVRPGASIPADGAVRDGDSNVNEALITGESALVPKTVGDTVIAGTVNGTGSLRVIVTGTGQRTTLAGIMRLVAQAQQSKSRAQALADRAAFWLTWVALGAASLTLIVWLSIGASGATAIEHFVSVLVIACPHALGLAVPLVLAISTTLGARNGLLIRDRSGFEDARNLTTVVFDKTGTLTLGEHRVVGTVALDGISERDALGIAASVERDAEHPVARAIVRSAESAGLTIPVATGFASVPGHGVTATVGGEAFAVGGPNLLASLGVTLSPTLSAFESAAGSRGEGVIYLLSGTVVRAAFSVADSIRPESAEAVAHLHAAGVSVVMMTGDATPVANAVGQTLQIETVLAQVLPGDKSAQIARLQAAGQRVAMVGDGVNDAPALVQANVGIAIGAGTAVAVESGDVVLIRSDPRDVARIITLSRRSYAKMQQNLWWAAGYNVIAIPLAAGLLEPWGVRFTPAIAAVLMSASTVVVALNAQLLRRATL